MTLQTSYSFAARENLAQHPMAKKLLKIMAVKKTNLALAADMTCQEQLLQTADELGSELCILKTHVDLLENFTPSFGSRLKALAEKHNFLIFEDRKFADIGQTVSLQYAKGMYRIVEWADIINAHILPGPGIIEALRQIGQPKGLGLLLLAEISSFKTLAKGSYVKKAIQWAEHYSDFVMGFISLRKLTALPGMIHCTPGVKLQTGQDALGQRYRTIEEVLKKNKSDLIIVGRDITQAKDPLASAKLYRQCAWHATEEAWDLVKAQPKPILESRTV